MKKNRLVKPKTKRYRLLFLIAAVLIAIAVLFHNKTKPSNADAEQVTALLLDHHPLSFAKTGVIDEKELKEIQGMDYKLLKNSLDIKNDFCVYVEDGNGNLIIAKGSSKLNKDGLHCKE